jgi:hypothetical protein
MFLGVGQMLKRTLTCFGATKYNNLLNSKIKRLFFRMILNFLCKDLSTRLYLSTDTKRLSEKLRQSFGLDFSVYPMYGVLELVGRSKKSNQMLINVRGNRATDYLLAALQQVPESTKKI